MADLLRQFLLRVSENSTPATDIQESTAASGVSANKVVLDVHVDGMHYTLIRSSPDHEPPQASLSPREKEIVRLVAKGFANKTIAGVLEMSQWTVSTHLRRVFAKLEVSSRAQMVARALEEGLLESGG